MKNLIIVLSIITLILAGCESRSSMHAKRNSTVRVMQLNYNIETKSYQPAMDVKLMSVDTLYRQGDTISNNKGMFIIIL
jgi:uncharacterized protein YcfL